MNKRLSLLFFLPIAGAVMGFFTMAVITYVMPKKFDSHVVFEVKPMPHDDPNSFRNASANPVGNALQILKSEKVLQQVVDELDLVNRWGLDPHTAINMLRSMITAKQIKSTDLVELRVRTTNKEDARDITSHAAKSLNDYLSSQSEGMRTRKIDSLRKIVREHEDRVEERRKIVTTIMKNHGVTAGSEISPLAANDLVEAKRELEQENALLQKLKLKLIAENIESNIADKPIVIHQDALIADVPSSPKVTLNLLGGIVGGAVAGFLVALVIVLCTKPTLANGGN